MDHPFPLIGLIGERQRLAGALRKREPLLLLGPAGSGKSALIEAAIADTPRNRDIVHLRYSANLHRLLVDLARCLFVTGHKHFKGRAHVGEDLEKWLALQTSLHLEGLLWSSLEAEPRIIVLDGIVGGSFAIYRFLQKLYFSPGMAILAAAREPSSLGAVGRLFWDPRNILRLRRLDDSDAAHLFDLAVDFFHLSGLEVDEFREKVLDAAMGNPGQIIHMCRLASNPMYVSGRHIKFAPLRIDVLMRFLA